MTRVLFSLIDAGIGGGQRVALELAASLAERGHAVGVVVPAPGPAVERFEAISAAVHVVDLTTLRRPGGVASAARALRGYDVLYSHTSIPGQILGGAAARLARRPHVVHEHSRPHFSPRPVVAAGQRLLFRRTLSATRFVAVAEHIADYLVEIGIRRGRIVVVPNGLDPVPAPAPRPDRGAVRVGMLARFDPGKGLHTFLQAARLAAPTTPVTYVLAGPSGPFADYERRMRAEAAEGGIEILSVQPSGSDFFRELDIVVIPSRWEGHPLVLLEAMAAGSAIVASDIPGIAEMLRPSGAGVLVPPEDPGALAAALAALADDPDRRVALGARAHGVVTTRYRLSETIDRALAILETAAGSPGHGAATGRR